MNEIEVAKFIGELRHYGLQNGTSLGWHSGMIEAAADLIETLQGQLSAAIDDLRIHADQKEE